MSKVVRVELTEDEKRVTIDWGGRYDGELVSKCKDLPGATYKPDPSPHWYIQARYDHMKLLREAFGEWLEIGPRLRKWAKKRKNKADILRTLHTEVGSAELPGLEEFYTELYGALHVGPRGKFMDRGEFVATLATGMQSFQCADVRFLADCPNPLNANEPGMGKTMETIGAILENEDTRDGGKLVVAPVSALRTVWERELAHWQDQPVIICYGSPQERRDAIQEATELSNFLEPFWLVTNPGTIQYRGVYEKDMAGRKRLVETVASYPALFELEFSVHVIDEFHKMGLGNTDTLTYKAMRDIKAGKRIALSGTPIGGVPIKLFGILSWLEPEEFTSKWAFAKMWMEIEDGWGNSKKIGGLLKKREDEFYEMLARFMVRRTKDETLPWLPPKNWVDRFAEMDGEQKKQYEQFDREAQLVIEEGTLSATSILAEFTRLKQFAFGVQELETYYAEDEFGDMVAKVRPHPTEDSCKLPVLLDILTDHGVQDGDSKAIVFSQFVEVVEVTAKWLEKQGISTAILHGGVTSADRDARQTAFNEQKDPQVFVMNTLAGGVSINLEAADVVIFLDETWNPDDQTQAEDRAHRGTKTSQVTIYYIRTQNSIEEYIASVTAHKSMVNFNVLDALRERIA